MISMRSLKFYISHPYLWMDFYVSLKILIKTKYKNSTPEAGDEGLKPKNSDSTPKIRRHYRFINIF